MNIPSIDIKEMLDADVNVNTTKYRIDRGAMDEFTMNCAVIYDFAGGRPQLTMDKAKYEFPSIQVLVRSTDYDDGYAFISSVVDSLHGRAHETVNGAYYSLIDCLNGPAFLKLENQRFIFVANFNIQRREA